MKLIGIIMLTMSCMAAGIHKVAKGRAYVDALKAFEGYMNSIKSDLRLTKREIDYILTDSDKRLSKSDKEILQMEELWSTFSNGLGKSMLQDQLEHCDICMEIARGLRGEVERAHQKNSKVTITLSSLGGLALAILLM